MSKIATFRTVHVTPRIEEQGSNIVVGWHFAFYENRELFGVGDIDTTDIDLDHIIRMWVVNMQLPEYATIE
jgi:hypothetical protein